MVIFIVSECFQADTAARISKKVNNLHYSICICIIRTSEVLPSYTLIPKIIRSSRVLKTPFMSRLSFTQLSSFSSSFSFNPREISMILNVNSSSNFGQIPYKVYIFENLQALEIQLITFLAKWGH